MKEWEAAEVIRKEANDQMKATHKQKIAAWEHDKATAKRLKKTFTTPKPKYPALQKQAQKP